MADRIHEIRTDDEIIPARPTIEDALGDPTILMALLHAWAQACELSRRRILRGEPTMMTPEMLRQRLRDSGG